MAVDPYIKHRYSDEAERAKVSSETLFNDFEFKKRLVSWFISLCKHISTF